MRRDWTYSGPLLQALILATAGLSLSAQSSQPGAPLRSAIIAGRVVDTTGAPVSGASLYTARYNDVRPDEYRTQSNERGEFTFSGLSPGRYNVSAQKPGYNRGEFPARQAPGQMPTLILGDGERRDITIVMPKFGVITGIVTDDNSAPLSRMRVYAVAQTLAEPFRTQASNFGEPFGSSAETDETGRYRLESVVPGTYLIRTSQTTRQIQRLSATQFLFEPVTFASAVAGGADGQPLKIEFGDSKSVDLSLRRVTGVRVGGVLQPAALQIRLALLPGNRAVSESDPRGIPVVPSPDGSFEFPLVVPGDYTLDAITIQNVTWDGAIHQNVALGVPANLQPTMWGTMPVTVGGTPIANVVLTVRPGLRVTGRMDFSGTGARPDFQSIREADITFARADGGRLVGWQVLIRVDGDGGFVATGLTPGRWQVGASIFGNWILKSAILAGQDVTGKPFTVGANDLGELVLTFSPRTIFR